MTNDDHARSITDPRPGSGIDAAFAHAFDRPLIAAIREFVDVIMLHDRINRNPERYPGHPRAAAIMALEAQLAHARTPAKKVPVRGHKHTGHSF
jgi:hypothetical protein